MFWLCIWFNGIFFFLTAEFNGIWESLVYEGGVKAKVNHPEVKMCRMHCWVLLNITLIFFSCSCWITWQQLFSSLTKTWTATWFPGTVLCCFMVNSSWGALLVISLFGVGWGCVHLRVMTDFSLCIQDPRAQGRRHSAKLLRRSCQSDCQTGTTAVISEIMLHQLLSQRS